MDTHSQPSADSQTSLPLLASRSAIGGVLMGLANLVPGISGGTMLLAAGVYPRFIKAIAELTTLRFRLPSMVVLFSVGLSAAMAIGLLAGVVKDLVVDHRWVMYCLFIGLTLGGIPVVWKMVAKPTSGLWAGVATGFLAMAALAWAQMTGLGATGEGGGSFMMMLVAGMAGASAMILPGVSGGYLLLVLGQYVPILGGIDALTDALRAGDMAAMWAPAFSIVLPVGLGVVLGVVLVSNLLKILLVRYETPTLGVLLGLLVGAVVGLWPFQRGVAPAVGDIFKGQVVTAEMLADLDAEKFPTEFFHPDLSQVALALVLVLIGFAVTAMVARLGRSRS